MKNIQLILFTFAILIVISCNNAKVTLKMELPPTPLYSAYANYLVSTELYTRVYNAHDIDSTVLNIARAGNVFILLDSAGQQESTGFVWYQVNRGGITGWILCFEPLLVYSLDQAKWFSRIYRKRAIENFGNVGVLQ